jgi:predicted PurR-regulated permease PerM
VAQGRYNRAESLRQPWRVRFVPAGMDRSRISLFVLFTLPVVLLALAPRAVLLSFAGVLLAVALRGLADPLALRAKIPDGLALGIVLVVLAALFWMLGHAAALPLSEQADKLIAALPETWRKVQEQVNQYGWARGLLSQAQPEQVVGQGQQAAQVAGSAISGTLAVFGDSLFLLLIGFYLAIGPATYLMGLSALLAPGLRKRFDHTLMELGRTLRWWLAGQVLAMVLVGLLTGVGLWLLGINLAFVLGALAGLLAFIPVVGAFISAIPAVLMALAQSPDLVLPVAGLFLAVHVLEGDFITPFVQSQAAHLPPALLLAMQLLMGALFGLLGLALAAPLLAALLVVARRGYVQGYLRGEESRPEG